MKSFFLYHLLSIGKIQYIYRYPVKGFGGEKLERTSLQISETLHDDRRYALLKQPVLFDQENPIWIHKENFLCAFTAPELMAQYRILLNDSQILQLYDRSINKRVLPPLDLSTNTGRQEFADYFSKKCNIPLTCVTAKNHQFGNTSSSWKKKRDTRCLHIVNKSTIEDFSKAVGVDINASRFRPNIVLHGLDAWAEFELIDRKIQLGSTTLEVISKTVRCNGVSIDPMLDNPLDPQNVLDIPALLTEHFPEHGPYLGVYAIVREGGNIEVGDDIFLSLQ
jgi:hypothetical protein